MAGRFTGSSAFWLTAAAALSGVVALEVTNELPLAPSVEAALAETAAAPRTAVDRPAVSLPSSDLIDAIRARPLFSTTRRPSEPETDREAAVAGKPDAKPALELIGTMRTGDAHVALLKRGDGTLVRARLGRDVGGWTIGHIADREVRLEDGEDEQVLTLRKNLVRSKPQRARAEVDAAARPLADVPKRTTSEPDAVKPEER